MSSSAGIGGAFGLLLPEFPKVAAIYADLKLVVDKALEEESTENPGDMESAPEVIELACPYSNSLRDSCNLFFRPPDEGSYRFGELTKICGTYQGWKNWRWTVITQHCGSGRAQ